jgi:hypothetical protein
VTSIGVEEGTFRRTGAQYGRSSIRYIPSLFNHRKVRNSSYKVEPQPILYASDNETHAQEGSMGKIERGAGPMWSEGIPSRPKWVKNEIRWIIRSGNSESLNSSEYHTQRTREALIVATTPKAKLNYVGGVLCCPARTLADSKLDPVTPSSVCPVPFIGLEPSFAECHRTLDERTLRISSASSSPSAEKKSREFSVTAESF